MAAAILEKFQMAISLQRLTIYLYSAHRAVIFAIAQLSCFSSFLMWAQYPVGLYAHNIRYVMLCYVVLDHRRVDYDCICTTRVYAWLDALLPRTPAASKRDCVSVTATLPWRVASLGKWLPDRTLTRYRSVRVL